MFKLINGEAITELNKLVNDGIKFDAIICDPPYGTTDLNWDKAIPANILLPLLYKLLRPCGRLIIFGNEPFYSYFVYEALMKSKDAGGFTFWTWSHEIIWIKKSTSSPLLANNQPLRYHEKIMVLNPTRVGLENNKTAAYHYIKEIQNKYFKGLPHSKLAAIVCHTPGATNHFFTDRLQWNLMPRVNYENMCSFIKVIDKDANLKSYDELAKMNENKTKTTYNPYTATIVQNARKRNMRLLHFKEEEVIDTEDTIHRTGHPKSYCVFRHDYDRRHPTAKPLELMKHLIKMYTNEHDLVLDFTMGSGTTGRACVELNRHFMGIEINEKYFNYASKWLNEPVIKKGGDELSSEIETNY